MRIKRLLKKIGIIIGVAVISVMMLGANLAWAEEDGGADVQVAPDREWQCATILRVFCDNADTDGGQTIKDIIIFAISILSVGIGVLATIGLIFCGYLIMSARENEQQVTKAKRRIIEIIIGIVLWALGAMGLLLLIPNEDAANYINAGGVIKMETIK